MADVIRMPKMSDTMEEGVIAAWNVKVGDTVKSGDILAEVETDKATMDMESYYAGTVLYIGVEKGQAVPIDAVMAVIGKPGEEYKALLEGGSSPAPAKTETPAAVIESPAAPVTSNPKIDTSGIKATLITMPLLSDTMTEGVIHNWLFKVGDKIKSGEMLAEIETDKATMEIEAYESGTLLYIGVEAGQAAPVNSVIAVIGEAGANFQALLDAQKTPNALVAAPAQPAAEAPAAPKEEIKVAVNAAVEIKAESNGRILASPLAKSLAKEKGVALDQVIGSGEGGRIVKSDIDNFKASAPVAAAVTSSPSVSAPAGVESTEVIAPSQMRKAISKGLTRNKFTAPEFFLTMEINMDKAMAARTAMNEVSPVKISFNDMVIKACAAALRKHPNVNSSWKEDKILKYGHIHIGMAVAIEDGLVVPVIRFADTLPLSQIAATTKDLGGKAKNKQLQPKDWEGNTFTVSNLGMFGIDEFTSIINNPDNEACILAVGGIKEIVAHKNGTYYPTNVMKVTLTSDHRVVDGASGAAFLVTLKEFLEEPYRMLV
jgi:pyruvate dehydrogenase E2 component (dihydrolipoamide acetyltransferase)